MGTRQLMQAMVIVLWLAHSCALAADSPEQVANTEAFNRAWAEYQAERSTNNKKALLVLAKNVVDAGRDLFADDDARMPAVLLNYGVALNAAGQRDAARDVLLESLQLSEAIHGKGNVKQLQIFAHLADAHGEKNRPYSQLKYYRKALGIADAAYGRSSPEYARLALRAGKHIFQLSYSGKGDKYLEEAASYFEQNKTEYAFDLALARFYRAKIEFSDRNFERSIEYAEAALDDFNSETDRGIEYQQHVHAFLVKLYEYRKMSDAATQHCIAIGHLNALRPDSDFIPLFRLAPRYPKEMLAQGKEGYVDLAFTVDKEGFVRDPKIINRNGNEIGFEKAATRAARRFRYAPKIVDGQAAAVEGVKARITFARK